MIGVHLPQVALGIPTLLLIGFIFYFGVQHLVCKLRLRQSYVLLIPIVWAVVGMFIAFIVLLTASSVELESQMFIAAIAFTEFPLFGYMLGYLGRRVWRIYLKRQGKLKK